MQEELENNKMLLSILVITTIFSPVYNFFTFGKQPLVLCIPLAFQLFSYVLWFLKVKPFVIKKSNDLSDQKYVILSSFVVFLSFCITAFDFILPYCLQQEYLIDNHTIFLTLLFSISIWYLLFWASLQEKFLQHPSKVPMYWGKILPFTTLALISIPNFLMQYSKILIVVLIFSVFILECIFAFLYNYSKHRHDQS